MFVGLLSNTILVDWGMMLRRACFDCAGLFCLCLLAVAPELAWPVRETGNPTSRGDSLHTISAIVAECEHTQEEKAKK